VKTIRDIEENAYSLAVPLYVKGTAIDESDVIVEEEIRSWNTSVELINSSINTFFKLL